MKMNYFFRVAIFLFLSGGSVWAQQRITCTYCTAGGTAYSVAPVNIPLSGGANSGNIALTGTTANQYSVFELTGAGNATLSGIISGTSGLIIQSSPSGTGSQLFNGVNTYTGETTVSSGKLGGTGSIASSSVTVGSGGAIFGGTGAGNNGTFTVGRLTFAAAGSKLEVYANRLGNTLTNTVSAVRLGANSNMPLVAPFGGVISVMDPINGSEGTYTVIATSQPLPSADFTLGTNNSGRCIRIIKTPGVGIQLQVSGPLLRGSKVACVNSSITLSALGIGTPGVWAVLPGGSGGATATVTPGMFTYDGNTSRTTFTAGNTPGTVTVTYTIGTSCAQSYVVTVNARPTLGVAPIFNGTLGGTTPNVCAKGTASANNQSIVLRADYGTGTPADPLNVTWTLTPATVSVSSAAPRVGGGNNTKIITGTFSGYNPSGNDIAYSVTYNDGGGCPMTITSRINTQPRILYSDGTATQTMCPNDTRVLTVSNVSASRSWQSVSLIANDPETYAPSSAVSFNPTSTGAANTSPGAWQSRMTGRAYGTAVLYAVDADGCRSELISAVVSPGKATITADSKCATGTSNPNVTLTVTYGSGYTAPNTVDAGMFVLSPDVKKPDVAPVVRRVSNTVVTYTFASKNDAPDNVNRAIPYTIAYDDHVPAATGRACQTVTGSSVIYWQPTVTILNNASASFCVGTSIQIQAAGQPRTGGQTQTEGQARMWRTMAFSSDNPNIASVNPAVSGTRRTPPWSATVTATTIGTANVYTTDGFGCRSEPLAINVISGSDFTLPEVWKACSGTFAEALTPVTSVAGLRYTWSLSTATGAKSDAVGPADNPTNGAEQIPGFQAPVVLTAATPLLRDIIVTGRASNGCSSMRPLRIAVNPLPVSNDYADFTICNGVEKTISPESSVGAGSPAKPDGFTWSKENASDASLGITYPAEGERPPSLTFKGVNNTAAPISNEVGIVPYNSATGCYGTKQVTRVTVSQGPSLSVSSVCPRGYLSGLEQVISITATYTGVAKPPQSSMPPAYDLWRFTTHAGSGNVTPFVLNNVIFNPNPSSNTVSMSFFGVARSDGAPNLYEITYNDGINCATSLKSRIDPPTTITAGADRPYSTSFCVGMSFTATGNAANASPITFTSENTSIATVDPSTSSESPWRTRITARGAGETNIRATGPNGCISDPIVVTVRSGFSLDDIADLTLCPGQRKDAWTPTATGAALTPATTVTFQWTLANGTPNNNVGLADNATYWKNGLDGFTAVNPGNELLTRKVTVWAMSTVSLCKASKDFSIFVKPAPRLESSNTLLCSGHTASDNLTLAGTAAAESWFVYSDAAGTTIANPPLLSFAAGSEANKVNVTAGTVTETANRYVAKYGAGTSSDCRSNVLSFTINVLPTMNSLAAVTLCGGAQQAAITPTSTGTGITAPTHYQWGNPATATNWDDVGLADQTADWTHRFIDGFTARNPALETPPKTQLLRDIAVTPYNSTSGCSGAPRTFTITVNATPQLTSSGTSLCAGQTSRNNLTIIGERGGNWVIYRNQEATMTDNGTPLIVFSQGSALNEVNVKAESADGYRYVAKFGTGASATCRSNVITFLLLPLPVMNSIDPIILCGGEQQAAITPGTTAEAGSLTAPTHYRWENLYSATNRDNVGLGDWTQGWTRRSIDAFTARNPPDDIPPRTQFVREVTVTPYNSVTGCSGTPQTFTITVNTTPQIASSNTRLCSGQVSSDNITITGDSEAGSWGIYNDAAAVSAANPAALSIAEGSTTNKANVTAASVSATANNYVVRFGGASLTCPSNTLAFAVNPPPRMNPIDNIRICANMLQGTLTPSSTGSGITAPTHFRWQNLTSAAHRDNVGLADWTSDWTKTAIADFTARDPSLDALQTLAREVTVTPYNSTSTCAGEPKTFLITVVLGMTLTAESTSPICSGSATNILLTSNINNTTYTWQVSQNANISGQSAQTEATSNPFISQVLTNSASALQSLTYTVTGTAGTCTQERTVTVSVSTNSTSAATVTGGNSFCVNPNNGSYTIDLRPSVSGIVEVEWTYTSYDPPGQDASVITGNTQQATRGALTAVTDRLVLSGAASGSVFYKFRPFINCLGNETEPVEVTLKAAPTLNAPSSVSICNGAAVSIDLSSPSPFAEAQYNWTVDRTNGPDVSGYTETTTRGSGPISDRLSMPANRSAQSITYMVTPWLSGCAGNRVNIAVAVNPLPTVIAPADLIVCSGAAVPSTEPQNLAGANSPSLFKWTGGATAGLPDSNNADPQADNFVSTGISSFNAAAAPGTPIGPLPMRVWGRNAVTGCTSAEAAFQITVNPIPRLIFDPVEPFPVCAGPTIDLAVAASIEFSSSLDGTRYTWSADYVPEVGAKGDVMISPDGVTTVPFETSSYELEDSPLSKNLTAAAGSRGTVTFTITPSARNCRGQAGIAQVPVSGNDLTAAVVNNFPYVCAGAATDIVLGRPGDGNIYIWTSTKSDNVSGNGNHHDFDDPPAITDVLTVSDNKQGWVSYEITAGGESCLGSTRTVTVNVDPVPTVSLMPETAQTVCSGTAANITLSNSFAGSPEGADVRYSWTAAPNDAGASSSAEPALIFTPQTLSHTSYTDETAVYSFTALYRPVGHPGCASPPVSLTYTVTGRVSAGPITIAGLNGSGKACLGDDIVLNSNAQGGGALRYEWRRGSALINGAAEASYTLPTQEASHDSYTVSVSNDCETNITSESKMAEVSPDAYFGSGASAASAVASPDAPKAGDITRFVYTGPPAVYRWDFGDNTFNATVQNPSHIYVHGGTYNPWVKASKPGNEVCALTIRLSPLTVSGTSYDPPTGDYSKEFSVFPIPSDLQVTVQSEDHLRLLTVSDLSGKSVMSVPVSGRQATLMIGHLSGGVYILTVTGSQGVKHVKIIKN